MIFNYKLLEINKTNIYKNIQIYYRTDVYMLAELLVAVRLKYKKINNNYISFRLLVQTFHNGSNYFQLVSA